jgi:glycosyltransferase involved in cell wall biosynthesis
MMYGKTGVFLFSCGLYRRLLFHRSQQIFDEWTNMREASVEFFYVDTPSYRRFTGNVLNRFLRHRQSSRPSATVYENKHILTGWLFPFDVALPDQQRITINKFFLHRALRRCCSDVMKKIAIVATPGWEPIICKTEFDLICYDYLDTIEMARAGKHYERIKMNHARMIEKSDFIFVTADRLKEEVLAAGAEEQNVAIVSNGVDVDFFENAQLSFIPSDYAKKDKKTVGYVGSISYWFDLELVYGAARLLPNVDFVLIGPYDKPTRKKIGAKPNNVYFLGTKQYMNVPSYMALFDVALIPFKTGVISDAVDPIKLYEYFALGKPVVSTSMNELKKLNDGFLLRIADTEEEFAAAIGFFLASDNEEWQRSRVRLAQENSWSSKAEQILATIMRRLATHERSQNLLNDN